MTSEEYKRTFFRQIKINMRARARAQKLCAPRRAHCVSRYILNFFIHNSPPSPPCYVHLVAARRRLSYSASAGPLSAKFQFKSAEWLC